MICVILENWLNLSSTFCFLISKDRGNFLLTFTGLLWGLKISSLLPQRKQKIALSMHYDILWIMIALCHSAEVVSDYPGLSSPKILLGRFSQSPPYLWRFFTVTFHPLILLPGHWPSFPIASCCIHLDLNLLSSLHCKAPLQWSLYLLWQSGIKSALPSLSGTEFSFKQYFSTESLFRAFLGENGTGGSHCFNLFPHAYKLMPRIPRKVHKPHEAMPSPSIPLLPPQVCSLPVKVSLSSQDSEPSIFFCPECLPLHLIPLSSSKPHPVSLPASSFPERLITENCKCSLLFLKNWTSLCVLCAQHTAWYIEDMKEWMTVFQIHVLNLWDSLESLHDFSFFLNRRKIYTFI